MPYARDPVSVLMDGGARKFLARVYEARGEWVTVRLSDPDPDSVRYARAIGIDVHARDDAPTLGGGRKNYRTRWGRAFARAVYYQHKAYGPARDGQPGVRASRRITRNPRPLELEIGRHLPVRGAVPSGRLVRARLRQGGRTMRLALAAKPASQRIINPSTGEPAARSSDATRRDWQ